MFNRLPTSARLINWSIFMVSCFVASSRNDALYPEGAIDSLPGGVGAYRYRLGTLPIAGLGCAVACQSRLGQGLSHSQRPLCESVGPHLAPSVTCGRRLQRARAWRVAGTGIRAAAVPGVGECVGSASTQHTWPGARHTPAGNCWQSGEGTSPRIEDTGLGAAWKDGRIISRCRLRASCEPLPRLSAARGKSPANRPPSSRPAAHKNASD